MGISKDGRKRLKALWKAMNQRCRKENFKEFHHYGGIGIKVCDEWVSNYLAFEKWALENGYDENAGRGACTLDRIDPFGDYSPDNCRWVNMVIQNNNKKIDVIHDMSDEFLYGNEVAELLGISVDQVDEMAKEELLPHIKIGIHRLYCRTIVDQFGVGVVGLSKKNSTYHRWTKSEDSIIFNPPTYDLNELSEIMGLTTEQIRTRLYRHGTTWRKISKGKSKKEQA